ncbi:hypothetical protein H310_04485 [Aphanomyces invadans]|uniref:Uncharacterized protein n=1 Tax=Aphanomyces invadans TaxID=157072 RepID=A0A024UCH4_9STRA|nr:hypothetical protein H310_04485 [Aphanomyces invadans]ETW04126.1 hypothetical protein H310_04485 [Aphanomyces invadans]|eukprot:XP_008867082.1 hypothetical protein H310_04485 [Aphanomyces invadans]
MYSTHDRLHTYSDVDEAMFQDVLSVLVQSCKMKKRNRRPSPSSCETSEKRPPKRIRITPFRRILALRAQVDDLTLHRDRLRHAKKVRREAVSNGNLVEAAMREHEMLLRHKDQLAAIILRLQADLFPVHCWNLSQPDHAPNITIVSPPSPCGVYGSKTVIKHEPFAAEDYISDVPHAMQSIPTASPDDDPSLLTTFDTTPSIQARPPPPYTPVDIGHYDLELDFIKMECL